MNRIEFRGDARVRRALEIPWLAGFLGIHPFCVFKLNDVSSSPPIGFLLGTVIVLCIFNQTLGSVKDKDCPGLELDRITHAGFKHRTEQLRSEWLRQRHYSRGETCILRVLDRRSSRLYFGRGERERRRRRQKEQSQSTTHLIFSDGELICLIRPQRERS